MGYVFDKGGPMRRRELLKNAGLAAVAAAAAPKQAFAAVPPNAASLDGMLRPRLGQHNLPALAAAAVVEGEIIAAGAVGTRRAGADIPVTLDDKFHIGSDTKAMTALLAGMLVEADKLRWDTNVAEIYPELAGTIREEVKSVQVDQLLSHTSGILDNDALDKLLAQSFSQLDLNLDELRYWLIKHALAQPLQSPPGKRFGYSNLGYTLAGAMIERVAGATWEELVTTRIFDPLGLDSAGFGPQSSLGRVDAPLGHRIRPDGTLKPMLAGPNGDNPNIIGPAGTAHLSILDFARWGGLERGPGPPWAATRLRPDAAQAADAGNRHSAPSRRQAGHAAAGTLWPRLGNDGLAVRTGADPVSRWIQRDEPRLYHAAA
jgi:CubicO group peptidase (beta-lactamase class C family)